jgi:nucleotide-binding universal stress UspA family protein
VTSKIVGRVIVGVDGSPGSLEALRYALREARRLDATLIPVHAWQPPGGEIASRRAPSPGYDRLVRDMEEKRFTRAFDEGLGGLPTDVVVEPWLVRGAAGPALVEAANHHNDLLVVGAGRRGRLRHRVSAGITRYCVAHAVCAVVAVPPPSLQSDIPTQLRLRASTDRLVHELTHAKH